MNKLLKNLKEEANKLDFNRQGVKAISALAKDATFFLRKKYMAILCFDFIAAILHAAAYILTLQVLKKLEQGQDISLQLLGSEYTNIHFYTILLALIVFSLICSIELKHKSFTIACEIWEVFSTRCAIKGTQFVNKKIHENNSTTHNLDRQLLKKTINQDAISVGFFAKQLAQILSHLLQIFIFFILLLYLNIPITLVILVLSSLLMLFYINSYLKVAKESNNKQKLEKSSRKEVQNLYQEMKLNDLSEKKIEQLVSTIFNEGSIGKRLSQKIDIRKNIKRGASIIEFANPLAFMIIGLIALNADYIDISMSTIIVYFLLLRQMMAIAVQIGDDLITINRVHPNIRNYLKLIDTMKTIKT